MRVAYLGGQHTFSHAFAVSEFPDARPVGVKPIEFVFTAVREGRAEAGVLPIFNLNSASMDQLYDHWSLLFRFRDSVFIEKISAMEIVHVLAGFGESPASIKKIATKDVVFPQVSKWLSANVPAFEKVEVDNTAEAVERAVKEKDPCFAAISSRPCAEEAGLRIIADGIQNKPNYTFFATLASIPMPWRSVEHALVMVQSAGPAIMAAVAFSAIRHGCFLSHSGNAQKPGRPPISFFEVTARQGLTNGADCIQKTVTNLLDTIDGLFLAGTYGCEPLGRQINRVQGMYIQEDTQP